MTLGQKLRFARKEKGLTLERLGELSGIHQNTISSYENESRLPSFHAMCCISDVLGISIDWLAGRDCKIKFKTPNEYFMDNQKPHRKNCGVSLVNGHMD